MRAWLLFMILLTGLNMQAQTRDSTDQTPQTVVRNPEPKKNKHSPKTATWLSVVLPGAGQIYNRKNWWWKVPIIYGAGAALVYGYTFYDTEYDNFRAAYIERQESGNNYNEDPYYNRFQTPTLKSIRDSYRQARDQCAIGLVLVYTLQILDASVEAHLLEFNVNDDLSLKVDPVYIPYGTYAYSGVRLNLILK